MTASSTRTRPVLDIAEIMKHLPHRYPMLLVDQILELEPGKRCVGIKAVTMNEDFFQGHFPGFPIMPGVLICEAMAQAGALIMLTDPQYSGYIPVIGAIDDVKFKRPVVPGDTLRSEVELIWFRNLAGRIRAVGTVEGEFAAGMEMTFKLVTRTG